MSFRALLIAPAVLLAPACGDSEPACHECSSGGSGALAGSAGSAGHAGHAGHSGAGGADGGDLASEYCDCMLLSCHDDYHAKYGPESDEVAARQACLADAASVPSAGSPVTSGNFIECRIHHCELGHSTPTACASSVGQGNCQ